MTTHTVPAHSAMPARPRAPVDAAVDMASRIEHVFVEAFTVSAKCAATATIRRGVKRAVFVTIAHHEAPTLNREWAASLASKSMPATALNAWFVATGLEKKKDMFAALQVSPSTLSRAKPGTTLDASVTERMLRQSELFVRAAEVFGDAAATWMSKPHELLDGKKPIEYATNEFGGSKVRQLLNAIEYGGVV